MTVRRPRAPGAFTLLELLVVLGIIGLLAGITLPAMKGMRQSNAMAAANRQLLDDIGAARQRAIKDGTVVLVLFSPPAQASVNPFAGISLSPAEEVRQKNILLRNQLTSYGLYAERSAGDQPGRRRPRFLNFGGGVWRRLPDGMFIAGWKFPDKKGNGGTNVPPFGFIRPFEQIDGVPVPTVANGSDKTLVPYIAFNPRGQLVEFNAARGTFELAAEDAVIPLARGSIFLARSPSPVDPDKFVLDWSEPDVAEKPPGNSVDRYNLVVVDKLTGRARSETPQIK
jgi:prepilin-type N-terminal cleavage/methylation domain-containing protein